MVVFAGDELLRAEQGGQDAGHLGGGGGDGVRVFYGESSATSVQAGGVQLRGRHGDRLVQQVVQRSASCAQSVAARGTGSLTACTGRWGPGSGDPWRR